MERERSTSRASSERTTSEGFDVNHYYAHAGGPNDSSSSIRYILEAEDDAEEPPSLQNMEKGLSTGVPPLEHVSPTPNGPRISRNYLHLDFEMTAHTRTPQKGRLNIFNPGARWRWFDSPHSCMDATLIPRLPSPARHHNPVGGVSHLLLDIEQYTETSWASLQPLVVATTDDIYASHTAQKPGGHTWMRTYMRNNGPWLLRIAYWPMQTVRGDYKPSSNDVGIIALRWVPAAIGLMLVMPFPMGMPAMSNQGNYDQFPYKYWGYAKVWRNSREDRISFGVKEDEEKRTVKDSITPNATGERLLRPTYLCYLREGGGIHTASGAANPENPMDAGTPYLFVAYSMGHFSDQSVADKDALLQVAEYAARKAGKGAFWCSVACMPGKSLARDIYRISDIIRGAESLVIVLKPGMDSLREWGHRMWTFPEALLSPAHRDIYVYTFNPQQQLSPGEEDHGQFPLEVIPKRDFARRAWGDASEARQLVDHFEGSQILSRLELAVIAFRCLHQRRQKKQHFDGDLSYALMGLLRRRPALDSTDSEFQAFARLSLANDNDRLLERLVCLLPRDPDGHWLTSDDVWDASPWDIYPKCQVAGVCNDDCVILDGCYAAAIDWSGLKMPVNLRETSTRQKVVKFLLRASPVFLIIILVFAASLGGLAAPLVILAVATILASPYLVRVIYGSAYWATEARLFGFEGYMDIRTIEAHMFGYSMNRMTWSISGTRLSRHSANVFEERVGRDPTDDPAVREQLRSGRNSPMGAQKIFTIVDTYTMNVHLVPAVRPPVMALACGNEGGMIRAVLCSYDCKTQTLFRESVLRMETPSVDKMTRISRVKFGFSRLKSAPVLPPTNTLDLGNEV